MKAISLARVSDPKQTDNYSVESQHNLINTLAMQRGITVIKELSETKSGRKFRDTVQEAYDYCKARVNRKTKKSNIRYILVYNWERWFRNTQKSYYWIHLFGEIGVEVNSVSKWINYHETGDLYIHAFEQVSAQVGSMKISENTLRGQYESKINGGLTNSRPPRGVLRIKNENEPSYIIPCPELGQYYTTAFDMVLNLIPPAQVYKQFGREKLGPRSSFYDALKNPVYAGRQYVTGKLPGQESKWVELRNKGTVTTWGKFQIVQDILKSNTKTPTVIDDSFVAKQVVKCPICNGNATSERSKGRSAIYHYYTCSSNRKHFRLSEPKVDSFFIQMIKAFSLSDEAMKYLQEKTDAYSKEGKQVIGHKIGHKKRELDKAQQRAAKALEMLIDGRLTDDEYDAVKSNVNRIEVELSKLQWEKENFGGIIEKTMYLVENIGLLYPDLDGKGKSLFLKTLFPNGLVLNAQRASESIKYCRTGTINKIFVATGCNTILNKYIKMDDELNIANRPVKGDYSDYHRTNDTAFHADLIERFLAYINVA